MELHAYTKTIYDLFSINKKYIVPRFQREYSWGADETYELWKDIIENVQITENGIINKEYFIGSLVLIGEDKSTELLIVDGQQRLTTITILLSALVETFKHHNKNDFAEGLYALIEGKNVANKQFFKLENETPKPYFQKSIQNINKTEDQPSSEEEKLLFEAYDFFTKRLQQNNLLKEFSEYYDKKTMDSVDYISLLEAIRDQVNQLKTIYITVAKEDDAYSIFETLNARGMNLSPVDLIKNDIFRTLQNTHPNDDAKDKWKQIRINLGSRAEKIDMETFFRHYWLSKYEFITEDKVYKSFKRMKKSQSIIEQFLNDLLRESAVYVKVTDPQLSDWKQQEEKEIFNSLTALNIFRVSQVRTLLIALMDLRENKKITLPDLKRALKSIENFHFIFSAVCSSRASGLESKYSRYARLFRHSKNVASTKKIIAELEKDLVQKLPNLNTFVDKFCNISFTNEETRQKKLIQYIFKKFEAYYLGTDELEISNVTLEHISAQSYGGTHVGKIGNLLPLAGHINNRVDRKGFSEKVKLFKESRLKNVEVFIQKYGSNKTWTDADIQERSKDLATTAYNTIWKIR